MLNSLSHLSLSLQDVQNFLVDPNFPMPLWNLGGSSASAGVTASPRLALLSESERTDRSEEETRETLGDQIKEKVMMSPICFGEQCDEGSMAGRTARSSRIPGFRIRIVVT